MNCPDNMLDLKHSLAEKYLKNAEDYRLVLITLGNIICGIGEGLQDGYEQIAPTVWVHKSAEIAKTAFIGERVIIGAGTKVRHCAFIRGNAIIGDGCVVGNSTEIKNSILFDGVQTPHFNYIGDSILGYRAHLGAGAITSNVRSDKGIIKAGNAVTDAVYSFEKLGALVGDFSEIGCNAVLNPGCVVGKNSIVYPLSSVRGVVPSDSIYKNERTIVKRVER